MSGDGRAYEGESFGRKLPSLELDRRQHVSRVELVAELSDVGALASADVVIEMTVPDARLCPVLDLQFVPDAPGEACPAFADTLHLSATVDLGGGPKPIEDLIGTTAAPLAFIAAGLWGLSFSPTEEVEGLRAALHFVQKSIAGKWRARARWYGLRPIGEQDWREIVGKCSINVTPRGRSITVM